MRTIDNVILVSCTSGEHASEAFRRIRALDRANEIDLREAAIVEREAGGRVVVRDIVYTEQGRPGTGLIGLLVGILGGPFGILIGSAGLLAGSLLDDVDAECGHSALSAMSVVIRPGHPALLVHVGEDGDDAVDRELDALGARVARRGTDEVEAEIAAAEGARRAARDEARNQLHAEHWTERKERTREQVEALRRTLDGDDAAAPS
jgi:uncharacterized membrane protein